MREKERDRERKRERERERERVKYDENCHNAQNYFNLFRATDRTDSKYFITMYYVTEAISRPNGIHFGALRKYNCNMHILLQTLLSVANCIRMWCMLSTFPRSTLHSVVFVNSDVTHSPPKVDRLVFRPSTALYARELNEGSCCHADLFSATFSKTHFITTANQLNILR